MRQCPNCGKYVPSDRTQCPQCRETLRAVPMTARRATSRGGELRRGLLYMLLAAVIHYFLGGYTELNLPFSIHPMVRDYLSPLLFLSGLGLIAYGIFAPSRS